MTHFKTGLIGCGAAGSHVLRWLVQAGGVAPVWAVDQRNLPAFMDGFRHQRELPAEPEVDLILLAVPDDSLPRLAVELASRWADGLKGVIVAQLSAASPLAVLNPLVDLGAETAMLHPLMTFPRRPSSSDPVIQIPRWAIAASAELRSRLHALLAEAHAIELEEHEQVPYHLGCVMTANALSILLGAAEGLLDGQRLNADMLAPILEQVIANSRETGGMASLSGPLTRGDRSTVRRHLDWLSGNRPDLVELYRQIQQTALALREPLGDSASSSLNVWLETPNHPDSQEQL